MIDLLIDSILRHSKRYFLFALATFLLLSLGLFQFKSDYSIPSWFGMDSWRIQKLNNYIKTFGNRGVHYVAVAFDATKDQIDLEQTNKLINEFKKLQFVEGVEASFNHHHISKMNGEIVMAPMLKKFPDKDKFFEELDKVESLKQYLVSHKLDFHIIYVRVADEVENKSQAREFLKSVHDVIDQHGQKELKYSTLGSVKMTATSATFAVKDNSVVMPLMFITMILILYFRYRNAFIVFVSLLVVGMTQMSSLGLYFHLGYTFNTLTTIIPGTLFPISLASTVHVFYNFFQDLEETNDVKKALRKTLSKNFVPVLLTTITTAIGFCTISYIEIIPLRSLGIVCSIGTFLAFMFTYFIIPHLLILRGDALLKSKKVETEHVAPKLFSWMQKQQKKILLASLVILLFTGWKALSVVVDNDLIKMFPDDSEINVSYQHVRKKMDGASRRFPLVIDSGKADGVLEPEFLKRVDQFANDLEHNGDVKNVTSGLDYIKQTNMAVHDNNPAFYVIPDTKEEIQSLLNLYESKLPQGSNIHHRISEDRRLLKFRNYWQVEMSGESQEKSIGYTIMAKEKYNLDVSINGFFAIYTALNGIITEIYFNSMIFVILTVFFIMLFKYRSLTYALLTMLPNVLSMIVLIGFMSLTGIELNLGTCIVASICLGITIDDSIHFMSSYIQLKRQNQSVYVALKETLESTGESIFITTFVLVLSFGCFLFGESVMYKQFGILCAVGLLAALSAGLILLPSVIMLLEGKQDGHKSIP